MDEKSNVILFLIGFISMIGILSILMKLYKMRLPNQYLPERRPMTHTQQPQNFKIEARYY